MRTVLRLDRITRKGSDSDNLNLLYDRMPPIAILSRSIGPRIRLNIIELQYHERGVMIAPLSCGKPTFRVAGTLGQPYNFSTDIIYQLTVVPRCQLGRRL